MVREAYFDRNGIKRGEWSEEEDNKLRAFVQEHGHKNWQLVPKFAGLRRCGKSCRLRWVNYLKPGLRRGNFTKQEADRIIKLHALLGNKWSAIAAKFPGRTDNDIKNYWHAHINKCHSKRKAAVTKAIRAHIQMEEQSSFGNNYCIIADGQEIKPPSSQKVFSQGLSTINTIAHSYFVAEPFPDEEEFHEFGLWQNDMSTMSDSSDGGSTSSDSTGESLANFWFELLEKGTIDMEL